MAAWVPRKELASGTGWPASKISRLPMGPLLWSYLVTTTPLSMRLPKEKYLGCCAWYFLILNWIKLPIFVAEGRITWTSCQLDLFMIPFILLGGALGIFLLRKLPQKIFEVIIQVLVVVAALRLLW